jgi:hypothetical protein
MFRGILKVVFLLTAAGLWWRYAARRRPLPYPAWLAWVLDNPWAERLGGVARILDRLDLAPGMRVLDVGCGPGLLSPLRTLSCHNWQGSCRQGYRRRAGVTWAVSHGAAGTAHRIRRTCNPIRFGS